MYQSSSIERITINPKIFGGKPIIRGLRISVETILDLLSQGATEAEILDDYPDLELEDIRACLAYAKAVVASEEIENAHNYNLNSPLIFFLQPLYYFHIASKLIWLSMPTPQNSPIHT